MIIPLPAEKRTLIRTEPHKRNAGPQSKAKIQQREPKIQQRDDSSTPVSSSGGGGLNSGAGVAITFGVVIVAILTIVIIRYSIRRKSQAAANAVDAPSTSRRGHNRQHSDDQVLLAAPHSSANASDPRLDDQALRSSRQPALGVPTMEQTSEDLPPRYDQVIAAPPQTHQRGGSTVSNEGRGRRSGAWRVSVIEGKSRSSR